jgi:hypothetical protein
VIDTEVTQCEPYIPAGASRVEVRDKALSKGLVVVELRDVLGKLVTCDFDNTLLLPKQADDVRERLKSRLYKLDTMFYSSHSASGCGLHVYYVTRNLFPLSVRVTLAASLGSDPVREAINAERLSLSTPAEMPVALFEKPDVIPELIEFLKKHAHPTEYKVHLP